MKDTSTLKKSASASTASVASERRTRKNFYLITSFISECMEGDSDKVAVLAFSSLSELDVYRRKHYQDDDYIVIEGMHVEGTGIWVR